ncbi:LapA family protein [Thorsellia kenyensis]|uniref:Lipopolysaccharide assembly protein A n=1 Tax=Thorsellia kenyensis TaxID=1549888 RepID=A0ABV6C8W8_9GAMM
MKLFISSVLVLMIITFGVMIGMRNGNVVEVNFLIAKMSLSLSIVMAICFGLGFLFTWIICGFLYFRLYIANKFLKRKIDKSSKQILKKEESINQLKHSQQLDADFMLSNKKTE